MQIKDMDNETFFKSFAEQKFKVKHESKILREYEEDLERRLNEGKLNIK